MIKGKSNVKCTCIESGEALIWEILP